MYVNVKKSFAWGIWRLQNCCFICYKKKLLYMLDGPGRSVILFFIISISHLAFSALYNHSPFLTNAPGNSGDFSTVATFLLIPWFFLFSLQTRWLRGKSTEPVDAIGPVFKTNLARWIALGFWTLFFIQVGARWIAGSL